MMKNWILGKALDWLASNLTEELVREWADKAKHWVLPIVHKYKDELIAKLREAAKKTENKVDDKAVDAFEVFVDAILPAP